MGIEDAAILGGVLTAYPDKVHLPTALALYENVSLRVVTIFKGHRTNLRKHGYNLSVQLSEHFPLSFPHFDPSVYSRFQ